MSGKIRTAGVAGEGRMGTSLFHYIAGFPFEMRWLVSGQADQEKPGKAWSKKIARGVSAGIISRDDAARMDRAVISRDLRILHDCDLVIEAVTEDKDIKRELFTRLDAVVSPDCILATNSSSILPSCLIPSDSRASCMVGLHFFYPVALKDIVELIIPETVSSEVRESLKVFLKTIDRNYLYQNEKNAFAVNRIFLEFQLEAWKIAEEGLLSPAAIDTLIRERFFPLGAFECFDNVGMDIIAPSIRNYLENDPDKSRFDTLLNRIDELNAAGKLGRKSGEGFFTYSQDSPLPHPSLNDLQPQAAVAESSLRVALEQATEKFAALSLCSKAELEEAVGIMAGL